MNKLIRKNLNEAHKILEVFSKDETNLKAIEQAILIIVKTLGAGNKIICCGNGGSMCDAMHFAEEMTGRFRHSRRPLPAIAISDPAYITCTANDFGFEYIFSRITEALGESGDVLLIFTSSGNSQNLLEAARVASEKGMKVIGLTGKTGGKLASLCDVEIRAPESEFADRAQEIHTKLIHVILNGVESLSNLNN